MTQDMKSGKLFFLVNTKKEIDLLDKNLILLFGSTQDFKNKINSFFPKTIWEDDGFAKSKTADAFLEFYFGEEEVIEKFVMVEVLFTENPVKEVRGICDKYHWLLYDLDSEKYINPENEIIS